MRLPILLIGALLLAGLAMLRLADPAPVSALRLAYFDMLQRLSPRDAQDLPVRIVDIDEASLARYGQWPWPRDRLADLTEKLSAAGVRTISYDMIFAEPDRLSLSRLAEHPELAPLLRDSAEAQTARLPDTDAAFASALARSPVVIGVAHSDAEDANPPMPKARFEEIGENLPRALPSMDRATPVLEVLSDAATGLGAISVGPGENGAISRSVPLLWNTPNGVMPGLALETLRVALGEEDILLWGQDGDPDVLETVGVGGFDIPVTHDGALWLRVRPEDQTDYIPAHAVLSGETLPNLQGTIVLVGTSAAGLLDLRVTALGETIPGVAIHAQAVEQILSGRYLIRTDYAGGLELAMFLFAGLLLTVAMSRAGPLASSLVGAGAGFAIAAASWAAFRQTGLLLDATFPLIGGFVLFSLLSLYRLFVTDRDARLIRRSLSHYVAPDVLRDIENHGHDVSLGGTNQTVSILFSDIRNFTGLSETMDAEAIVQLLNDLFDRLSDAIMDQRGTIDKFMGDSVMAFWNAPVPAPDHAERACAAALEMRKSLAAFNAEASRPVAMGVGLATGVACVGNIGSRDRFNYTAIGEAVNLTARIEAACRRVEFDILASRALQAAAPGFAWLDAGHVRAKGLREPVPVVALLGDAALAESDLFQHLASAHETLIQTLARGADAASALAQCKSLAAQVPGLEAFYDRIEERREDFSALPPTAAAS